MTASSIARARRQRLRPRNDTAVAGIVAGILMLGAMIAFLSYVNAAWVPTWTGNKESGHSTDLRGALADWATEAEDHAARQLTGRTWTRSLTLGVSGIPFLGTGASTDQLAVNGTPTLTVTNGATTVLTASGAVSITTNTLHFPTQTLRYHLGAIEVNQSDGAWIDLRSFLRVERTIGNQLNVTLQAISLTGGPQSAGGSGQGEIRGTLADAGNATQPAGTVRLLLTGVSGDAWRAALQRSLDAKGLVMQNGPDCSLLAGDYCFNTLTNSATLVVLEIPRVTPGWTASSATVAVEVRS